MTFTSPQLMSIWEMSLCRKPTYMDLSTMCPWLLAIMLPVEQIILFRYKWIDLLYTIRIRLLYPDSRNYVVFVFASSYFWLRPAKASFQIFTQDMVTLQEAKSTITVTRTRLLLRLPHTHSRYIHDNLIEQIYNHCFACLHMYHRMFKHLYIYTIFVFLVVLTCTRNRLLYARLLQDEGLQYFHVCDCYPACSNVTYDSF